MAVKRTKRQKKQTATRREEVLSYSINDVNLSQVKENSNGEKGIKLGKINKVSKNKNTVKFDTSYVLKDLTKTIIVTLLVVGVLVAYTIYIK